MPHFIPFEVETYGFGFASKVLNVEPKMDMTQSFLKDESPHYKHRTFKNNQTKRQIIKTP